MLNRLPSKASQSKLVYATRIDLEEAVEAACNECTSETVILNKAANIIRCNIKDSFKSSASLSWPLSVETLQSVSPPKIITSLLLNLIVDKNRQKGMTNQSFKSHQ